MKTLTITLAALAIIAIAILTLTAVSGCITDKLPSWIKAERSLAKDIEVQKAALAGLEAKLAAAKAAAEAEPTVENLDALAAKDAETVKARIVLINDELDLDLMRQEIAEGRELADETESALIDLVETYAPAGVGGLLAGLIPYVTLLIKNRATAAAAATRQAATANVIASVQPIVNALSKDGRDQLDERQTHAAKALIDEMQDLAKANTGPLAV